MIEHSVIYLSPSDDPEREWCHDDVWENSVRYNLGTDFDRVTAERDAAMAELCARAGTIGRLTGERDALQALLTAADERADVLEGLLRDWRYGCDMTLKAWAVRREKTDAALKPARDGGDA